MSLPGLCLIHLGPQSPAHLWENTDYLQRTFSGHKLSLVLNDDKLILRAKGLGYNVFRYEPLSEVNRIFELLANSYDHDFRQGFWRYSLERVFALIQFHQSNPGPLLHLESDVLITTDFPFNKFVELNKIAWQSLNDEADVAALLYSPSFKNSLVLYSRLVSELQGNPNHTDMTVLAALRKKYPGDFETLPSGINCERNVFNSYPKKVISRVTEMGDRFSGYFDPAALGMWNFGQDPRNHFGFSRRHVLMPESIIDPSRLILSVSTPLQIHDQYGDSVFSLHIHSKNVKFFSTELVSHLEKYLNNGSRQNFRYVFYPRMFVCLLRDYHARRKLHELISNVPLIGKLRRFKRLWNFLGKIARF